MSVITEYKRFENESDEELIYRVTGDKDKIGSWQGVADILNGLLGTEYTESKFRKQRQAFDRMLKANESRIVNADEQIAELDKKIEELRKERIKLQTVNVERNRVDRSQSRQELYYEYVGNIVQALPMPEMKPIYPSADDVEEIKYVVGLADVHYGAEFTSFNNEYSPAIAEERFRLLTEELLSFIQKKNLKNISVVSLGDLIQGIIHMSDLKINDSSVVKATVEVCRLVAMLLNELSRYVTVDYYHTPSANHTQIRVMGAKANELADEDLEYLMGNYIKDLCKQNNRVRVHLAEEGEDFIRFNILGFNILAVHGHQLSNLENAVRDLSMLHREFYDAVMIGHYHNGKELPSNEGVLNNMELLCCPSFIGSDPYSDKIHKGSKAAVKIFGFSDYGGHTETYNIILN